MRASAQSLAQLYTTNAPEGVISSIRTQLDQLISSHAATGHAFAQLSEMTPWLGSLRWTIRADVSRTRRCAESPTRRAGTTRVGSEASATSGTSDGTSATRETEAGPEGARSTATSGHTTGRTTGGTGTSSSSVEATGPVDLFEEQWDYSVEWVVTAELDPDSIMSAVPRMFGAMTGMPTQYSENGITECGTASIMNADATPPASGGGAHRRPHRPERLE